MYFFYLVDDNVYKMDNVCKKQNSENEDVFHFL